MVFRRIFSILSWTKTTIISDRTCYNPSARDILLPINTKRGQLRELEKRRSRVEESINSIAGEQFSARSVAIAGASVAAEDDLLDVSLELVDELFHPVEVVRIVGILRLDQASDRHRLGHAVEGATRKAWSRDKWARVRE